MSHEKWNLEEFSSLGLVEQDRKVGTLSSPCGSSFVFVYSLNSRGFSSTWKLQWTEGTLLDDPSMRKRFSCGYSWKIPPRDQREEAIYKIWNHQQETNFTRDGYLVLASYRGGLEIERERVSFSRRSSARSNGMQLLCDSKLKFRNCLNGNFCLKCKDSGVHSCHALQVRN